MHRSYSAVRTRGTVASHASTTSANHDNDHEHNKCSGYNHHSDSDDRTRGTVASYACTTSANHDNNHNNDIDDRTIF